MAQGGYSATIRTHDRFVFAIPESIKSEHAGPLMCAGLTVYSPLKRNGTGPGKTVGIIGIGGLGRTSCPPLFTSSLYCEHC
jgi:alcohol dehydrogenase (NADP+)